MLCCLKCFRAKVVESFENKFSLLPNRLHSNVLLQRPSCLELPCKVESKASRKWEQRNGFFAYHGQGKKSTDDSNICGSGQWNVIITSILCTCRIQQPHKRFQSFFYCGVNIKWYLSFSMSVQHWQQNSKRSVPPYRRKIFLWGLYSTFCRDPKHWSRFLFYQASKWSQKRYRAHVFCVLQTEFYNIALPSCLRSKSNKHTILSKSIVLQNMVAIGKWRIVELPTLERSGSTRAVQKK